MLFPPVVLVVLDGGSSSCRKNITEEIQSVKQLFNNISVSYLNRAWSGVYPSGLNRLNAWFRIKQQRSTHYNNYQTGGGGYSEVKRIGMTVGNPRKRS